MNPIRYKRHGRHATWLELFFDLVFVAVIGVVTHDLAHTHDGHISLEQLLRFPLVFIPVWWVWMSHTLFANRFDRDSRSQRLVSLAIMATMIALSVFAEHSDGEGFLAFALLYGITRLLIAVLYGQAHRQQSHAGSFAREMALITLGGAAISTSAVLFDGYARFGVFYLGLFAEVIAQLAIRHRAHALPIDRPHLVERMGLLAIIILGESIIAIVASLDHGGWDLLDLSSAATGLLLIGSIWWIYFDSFPTLERANRLSSANILIFTNLILCMGLLILANMIRHTILGDLDQATFALLSVTGLCCFYAGKQVPYWYAFPPWRGAIIGNTVVCVGITIASTFLPSLELATAGMTLGMLVYVYLTFTRILAVNVDDYLDTHHG